MVSFVAAGFCGGLGIFVLVRDRHSFVHWTFAVGMIVFSLEAMLTGLSVQADLAEDLLHLQRIRLITTAFIPSVWLLFSLITCTEAYRLTLGTIHEPGPGFFPFGAGFENTDLSVEVKNTLQSAAGSPTEKRL
jgi:hypothetical protein